ncbi:bifunctional TH2 protein, mitochondrial [Dioscorea cayenensis subsp. rotundata]|uniref:Bifunctional TH2 protein, mitochondrial n=1 Tax=Dioscorea cayennensis subsp. rotundata TaxID=55577 RepID=A0AB40AQ61_DIOCR|nr:bifunctional TH2 protein, mitochondrial [Dioscorea cayenensis subsp. rotundata]
MRFLSPILLRSSIPSPSLLFSARTVSIDSRFGCFDRKLLSVRPPARSGSDPPVHRGFRASWLRGGALTSSPMAEEGSVARRFWINSLKETVYAAYTPFVVCLAAGNLEMECFRNYIAQDVHFLRAYVQAYEMAEDCADDDDAKAGISDLRKSALEELKMHNSIVEEWGVDTTKEIAPFPATTKYIDFLLATAAGKVEGGKVPVKIVTPFEKTKIAAYTVGAMTPCMSLYAFLGKKLQMFLHLNGNNHPYKKWIENYASKNFEAAAEQIEELLDKLSVTLTGEELELIQKLYQQAMRLEIEFFLAQPIAQPAVVPLTRLHDPANRLVIFSDFDLTCTVVDSSAILAEIAILTAPKADLIGLDDSNARISSTDLRNSWDSLSGQYTEEYEQCIENILPSDKASSFDYEGLRKSLEHLSNFEKQANSRVVESGVLRGMNLDDIKRAGELLSLQEGCRDFFQKIVSKQENFNADIHILSYCWCGDLIRSAFASGSLNVLNIHANEFEYNESISTGNIIRKMESPLNKVEAFKDILGNAGDKDQHLSVYIGDSVGDLLCLLEADVGIVIGSSTSLRKVGEQFGVSFVPLFSGLVAKQKHLAEGAQPVWKGLSGVLYTVSSWTEIQAFILGE